MSRAAVSFDANYSPESFRQAGVAFRDYQFKRYRLLMIAACVVNAIAFAFMLWLGVKPDTFLYFIAFVVVIGPVWLLYEYVAGPRMYEFKLNSVLAAGGRVVIDPEAVTLPGQRGDITFPWPMIKVIVEQQSFFLLVLSPFSSYFIPRSGMPAAGYDVLHSRVNFSAA